MIASVMEVSVLATALGVNASQPRQSQAPAEVLRRKIREAMSRFMLAIPRAIERRRGAGRT